MQVLRLVPLKRDSLRMTIPKNTLRMTNQKQTLG
jgi:hypothetical protein